MEDRSKSIEKLREYLKNATQEELDARLERIKELNLPQSPTLAELISRNNEQEEAS